MCAYNLFVSAPKFTNFVFVERGRGCSLSLATPILDISVSVPDILAVEVKSRSKLRQGER